jgi:hypothetical protein
MFVCSRLQIFVRVCVDIHFDSKRVHMRLFSMMNIINSVKSERTREKNLHNEILARKEFRARGA